MLSIRYCAMCGYEAEVLSLASQLMTEFKRKLTKLELIPDAGGTFEVMFNDELIYSKLATDEFPVNNEVVADVARRLKA